MGSLPWVGHHSFLHANIPHSSLNKKFQPTPKWQYAVR